MPTTSDNDKYDEETRREEARMTQLWNTIFSCGGYILLAILVIALFILLSR